MSTPAERIQAAMAESEKVGAKASAVAHEDLRAILALLTPKDGEVAAVVERLRVFEGHYPGPVIAEAADLLVRLSAQLAEVTAERDGAQSTCTAWQQVYETIEAHIQDRIAMGDPANPELYLSLIRSDVAGVIQTSKQISAARWADARRHRDALDIATARAEKAEAEVARLREALSKQIDNMAYLLDLGSDRSWWVEFTNDLQDARTALAALTAAEAARPADVVAGLERAVEIAEAQALQYINAEASTVHGKGYQAGCRQTATALRAEIEKERAR